MSQRSQNLEVGNHILAIYNNREEKFNEIFEFLKMGFLRNEVAMLITEELTKEEIIERMKTKIRDKNIEKMVEDGDFIIKSTSEWYSRRSPQYPKNKSILGRTIKPSS